jgi:hypothetical protein
MEKRWNVAGRVVSGASVTPSDTTVVMFDALFVGTHGDVSVILKNDTAATVFKNIGDGEFLPIAVTKVMAATTAADIKGLNCDNGNNT